MRLYLLFQSNSNGKEYFPRLKMFCLHSIILLIMVTFVFKFHKVKKWGCPIPQLFHVCSVIISASGLGSVASSMSPMHIGVNQRFGLLWVFVAQNTFLQTSESEFT